MERGTRHKQGSSDMIMSKGTESFLVKTQTEKLTCSIRSAAKGRGHVPCAEHPFNEVGGEEKKKMKTVVTVSI